jgi:hypothetical protein
VLFLAAGVGEAEVDELNLFVFEHLQHVGWGGHARSPEENDGWTRTLRRRNELVSNSEKYAIRRGVANLWIGLIFRISELIGNPIAPI